jgi:predicted O-methyltransferase YrrM
VDRTTALRTAVARALRRQPFVAVAARVARLVAAPSLQSLCGHAELATTDGWEAAHHLVGPLPDSMAEDWRGARATLQQQLAEGHRSFPEFYEVGDETSALLYALVRAARPTQVVEVGVADGRSSAVILAALDANDHGTLVSVDIAEEVGGAARGHPRWELRIHQPRTAVGQLERLLAARRPIDLFFHDGSHRYADQYAEYALAIGALRRGGLLVSDDVDATFAFLDVAARFSLPFTALVDSRRVTGAAVVG